MSINFRRGSDAAERAAESQKSGSFQRVKFAQFTAQEPRMTVRFLTDFTDWITLGQHQNMRTRQAPSGYKGNWPPALPAICRANKTEDGELLFPDYADCYGCLHGIDHGNGKASRVLDRTFALGIERVVSNVGGQIAISDKMVPVNHKLPDGSIETRDEPAWLIFAQAWGNFWSQVDAVGRIHGTILDRDFSIVRKGFGQRDTDYQIASYDPLVLQDGQKFDLRDPQIVAYYGQFGGFPDLGELLVERSSNDYYARFFDTRVPQPVYDSDKDQAAPGGQVGTVAPPPTEVDQTKLADMASRIGSMGGGVAPYPAAQQAPAQGAVVQTAIAQPGFPQQG